jgi:hypothetical protein
VHRRGTLESLRVDAEADEPHESSVRCETRARLLQNPASLSVKTPQVVANVDTLSACRRAFEDAKVTTPIVN